MNNQRHWNRNQRGSRRPGGYRYGINHDGWNVMSYGQQSHGPYRNQRGFPGNRNQSYGSRNSNQQQWNRSKRDTPGKRLSEDDIGVTEYMSEHKGFTGIIKSRYSDFQVSEINEKGEIAQLTDLSVPLPTVNETIVEDDEDLLFSKYNLEILPMDTWDNINKLAVHNEPSDDKVEIDVTGMTKEQRTKIHDAVKKAFGACIVGSTVTVEEKKFVVFTKFRKGVRIDNRVKWTWPAEYLHFIVHKQNCDTMEAATRIAEQLRMNLRPTMLGYAGTKDRRAKTSQWFSLRKVDPKKVALAGKALRDIHLGNYSFSSTHLKLGMLKGNKFRIALRNVTSPEEAVENACTLLKTRGFLNYYGLQRFGTRAEVPTYNIGMKVLQNDFQGAIDCILQERDGPLHFALRKYKQHGAEAAARALPRSAIHQSPIETKLIESLAKNPTDLVGSFNRLARNTRLLYLHAYQSLVWNQCVSERVRRLGLTPAVGDLVPLADINQEIIEEEVLEDENNQADSEGGGDVSTSSEPDADDPNTMKQEDDPNTMKQDDDLNADEQDGDEKSDFPNEPQPDANSDEIKNNKKYFIKAKVPVKTLTQEDVDSGKYTIFDIVLPLPGYNIEYPTNMKDYYEKLLTKDGLTLQLRHKIKCYSMCGAYRHIAMRPLGMEWKSVRYSDPRADLILSDYDLLEGNQLDGIIEDGKYKAVLLTVLLPASCYATMALRELLKVDTSSDYQATQNDYHKAKTIPNTLESVKENFQEETEDVKDSSDVKETDNVEEKTEGVNEESDNVKEKNGSIQEESENGKVAEKRKLESDTEEVEAKRSKEEDQ